MTTEYKYIKLMNASGCHCTTKAELEELYNCSACDMIVSKSCTINSREGNPLPRYYETDTLSINSTGLRNKGLHYYLSLVKYFEEMNKASRQEKRYIISYADLENIDLFISIVQNYYSIHKIPIYFEINLSCPNIPGKGQIGYDFAETRNLLDYVFTEFKEQLISNSQINIGVKLPAYFDAPHFEAMAEILNNYPLTHITCINSLGNGFVFNEKIEQAVAGNNGYGGIGGSVIKPFGLSNVRRFRNLIRSEISIYGCGGITSLNDIYEYKLCGADVVQIGTKLVREGISIFNKLKQ